jgi:hypothetical protein
MQKYVISAVLPVRSVTIQDLEHIDGPYHKVATKMRCQNLYIWYSTVIVAGLVQQYMKGPKDKVRDENADRTFGNNINYERRQFTNCILAWKINN